MIQSYTPFNRPTTEGEHEAFLGSKKKKKEIEAETLGVEFLPLDQITTMALSRQWGFGHFP